MTIAGRMGMSEHEFDITTPRYFFNRQRGFFDGVFETEKSNWERARWLAMYSVAPHTSKNLKVEDLAVFPWENGAKTPKTSKEEMAAWDIEAAQLWEKWHLEETEKWQA